MLPDNRLTTRQPGGWADFRPSRSLGQSFLVSAKASDALVAALEVGPADTVLEIGPGKGVLTRRLVQAADRVVAVEIDRRLVEFLGKEFAGCANLEIVRANFLGYDFSPLGPVKVIGNLPYNISSQILFRLLDCLDSWTTAVMTAQREFANRVLAGPGTKAYGALSVFLERVCQRDKLMSIPPSAFRPEPAVVSTGLRLQKRKEPLFPVADEPLFRRAVKACFSQRRKTLANSLAHGLNLSKEQADVLLREADVQPKARAEALTLEQFRALYEAIRRGPLSR